VSEDGDAEPGSDAKPVNTAIDIKNNDTQPKWYQQTWLIVLFLVFIPLIGIPMAWLGRWPKQVKMGASAASAFFLILTLIPGLGITNLEEVDSQETTEQTQSTGTSQGDEGSESSDNTTSLSSNQSDPSQAFGEAMRAATSAAEATQSARTPQQWSDVATSWQQAIDLLKDVPESDANYATAQTKIQEYSSNLAYASSNATAQPENESETASRPSQERTFLGEGPTGYTLWLGNDDCIYVKDIRESDFARLGVSMRQFKQVVKEETGSRCVFFE
jgi:hypothetical protein